MEESESMEEIPYTPTNLEHKRKELGLSRKDVENGTAELGTKIDQATIYKYEKGYRRKPGDDLQFAEPTVSQLETLGKFFTIAGKKKVKFVCEWDERAKSEYADQTGYEDQLKPKAQSESASTEA